ncbi:MAG: antA/AntB antirepressor family protein [Marinobacter sp.]|nr:antA/AntB antirepressor family protein [Marinobacter sp.]
MTDITNTPAIPVVTGELYGEESQTCRAQDLHSFLKVGRDFSAWFKNRVEKYGFEEGRDYSPVLGNIPDGRGKPRIDYHISLDMAKELSMIENNDMGRQVRRYFIEVEKRARQLLEDQANQVQPIEQVKKRIKDTGSFKFMKILQEQSHKIAKQLSQESDPVVRYNLHCQLRQVNGALGIPTLPFAQCAPPAGSLAE